MINLLDDYLLNGWAGWLKVWIWIHVWPFSWFYKRVLKKAQAFNEASVQAWLKKEGRVEINWAVRPVMDGFSTVSLDLAVFQAACRQVEKPWDMGHSDVARYWLGYAIGSGWYVCGIDKNGTFGCGGSFNSLSDARAQLGYVKDMGETQI